MQRVRARRDAPLGDAVAHVDLVAARRGQRHRGHAQLLVVVVAVVVPRASPKDAPPDQVQLLAPRRARASARVANPGEDRLVGGRQLRRAPAPASRRRRRRCRRQGGAEEEQGRQEEEAEGPGPRTPHGCAGARARDWPACLALLRWFLEGGMLARGARRGAAGREVEGGCDAVEIGLGGRMRLALKAVA